MGTINLKQIVEIFRRGELSRDMQLYPRMAHEGDIGAQDNSDVANGALRAGYKCGDVVRYKIVIDAKRQMKTILYVTSVGRQEDDEILDRHYMQKKTDEYEYRFIDERSLKEEIKKDVVAALIPNTFAGLDDNLRLLNKSKIPTLVLFGSPAIRDRVSKLALANVYCGTNNCARKELPEKLIRIADGGKIGKEEF